MSNVSCSQRALLEQKQRRKRQELLMVQPNPKGCPRRSRPRHNEEQAPLVESRFSITSDVIMDGKRFTAFGFIFVGAIGTNRSFANKSIYIHIHCINKNCWKFWRDREAISLRV